MKVIFFDVDGVLNSKPFYDNYSFEDAIPMTDPACVKCLAEIVRRSGAVLVCSSSWRAGWDKDPAKIDKITGRLVADLAAEDLEIYDKTGFRKDFNRSAEVLDWLIHCRGKIDGFLCIDDVDFGWKKYGLDSHLIQTDFTEGGLMPCHIEKAVDILEKEKGFSRLQKILWRLKMHSSLL